MGVFDRNIKEKAMKALLDGAVSEPEVGTPIGSGKFRIGDRVRVTVDVQDTEIETIAREPDCVHYRMTAGTIGVIISIEEYLRRYPHKASSIETIQWDVKHDLAFPVRIEKVAEYSGPSHSYPVCVDLDEGSCRHIGPKYLERI